MDTPLAIRRILVPTDFSDGSSRVGEAAVSLARQFDARVTVLHVVPPVTDPEPRATAARSMAEDLAAGVAVDADVVIGFPAGRIVRYAREHAIDLIVMGTYGRTGISHALRGSVAEAVVRRAPCPVLTLRARPGGVGVLEASAQPPASICVLCAEPSNDLVCDGCLAHLRGEMLGHTSVEERAGPV